jgi:hypothetical protein
MEPQQTNEPAFTPAQPATPPTPTPAKSNHKRTVLALWLMIGPTALIIASILLYAIMNFMFAPATPAGDNLFGEQTAGQTITNVILFIVGAISVMTWLPGLIIGIILLATKKK